MKWWTESGPVRKPPAPTMPVAPAKLTLVSSDFSTYTPPALRPGAQASASPVPVDSVRADAGSPSASTSRRRAAWRWVRDAAIGVALLVAAPVAIIGLSFRPMVGFGLRAESHISELGPLRALRAPQSEAVNPQRAGEAMARLSDLRHGRGIPLRFAAEAKAQLGMLAPPDSTLFATMRHGNGAVDYSRLIDVASRGLSAREIAWLQQTALLPLWRDADLVAQAAQVDVLGGRFAQPMNAKLSLWAFPPAPSNNKVRELAQAGVARAAWYVTKGDFAAAEASLRTVVSFGFALVDNGGSLIDAMIGRTAIRVGSDGLAQLAVVRGDHVTAQRIRAQLADTEHGRSRNPATGRTDDVQAVSIDDQVLLNSLSDRALPQSTRMERRMFVSYMPCNSVRGILFGLTAEQAARLSAADRVLARYPSEAGAVAAMDDAFRTLPARVGSDSPAGLLLGLARVASTVTGNERIAACMAPIAGGL